METNTMRQKMDKEMKFEHVEFDKNDVIKNMRTGEQMKIRGVMYDPRLCDIVYKCSHIRYRFDMVDIPECVIASNIERNRMKVISK